MKKDRRSYIMYLEDILQSIERIAEYINNYTYNDFKNDYKTVDAVIRNLEIIGEASKNLPANIRKKYPDVPWTEMYLLRNKVSHEYFALTMKLYGISLETIFLKIRIRLTTY